MRLEEHLDVEIQALVGLYDSVGWSAYTAHPHVLQKAVAASTWGVTAWEADQLVGLLRVLTDGWTILYVQDVLVRPSHHRRGLGRRMLAATFERYAHVRQKVLMTDDRPEQHAFYASLGMTDTRSMPLHAFVRFENA